MGETESTGQGRIPRKPTVLPARDAQTRWVVVQGKWMVIETAVSGGGQGGSKVDASGAIGLRIRRTEDGMHTVDGKPVDRELRNCAGLYRKRHLTRAVQLDCPFSVETMEGTMQGKAGDWLMIGVNGEMYPCDADVFDKTYEPAEGRHDI